MIRGASVPSREECLYKTRIAKNIPVSKLIALTTRRRDAVAPNGAISLPTTLPVRLKALSKVQVFNADQSFVEAANRIEGLAQKPEHSNGHARPDKIGSDSKKAKDDSYRPPFELHH